MQHVSVLKLNCVRELSDLIFFSASEILLALDKFTALSSPLKCPDFLYTLRWPFMHISCAAYVNCTFLYHCE